MIWILLLCHFIADYPLQSDAMVQAKKQVIGLLGHVALHFITLLVIMIAILKMDLIQALPAILALTGFHFAIDTWKNILNKLRPDWVIFAYLQDQVLHLFSILLVASFIDSKLNILTTVSAPSWVIPALSILLVTYVWFITERVLFHKNTQYQQWANRKFRFRMTSRALLLIAWYIGWNGWAMLVIIVGLTHNWLDLAGPFHLRALLIDISVVLCVATGLHIIYLT